MQRPLMLRKLHRISAIALAAFLVLHMANHLTGLAGQDWHIAFMAVARNGYRNPFIEPVLIGLAGWQVASGLTLLWKRRKARRGPLAWAQQLSGLYLGFFLLIHVGAVISGRYLLGLDTDFRFAAAGMHVGAFIWFFAPYYFLAVFSLFVHAGCGIYWNLLFIPDHTRKILLALFCSAGFAAGLLIVLALAGALYPVSIPDVYRSPYQG